MIIIVLLFLYFYIIYQNGIRINTNIFNKFHGKKYKFKIPINNKEYIIFWYYLNDPKNKTIIYFPGYNESYNLFFTPNRINIFTKHPYNLNFIICDYRGIGLSKGKYTEKNMLDDGIYLITYILSKENRILDINIKDIILYGYSISTITILHINKYLYKKNYIPYKIILEAPLYKFSYNYYVNNIIQKTLNYNFQSNIIDNLNYINCSILILHGLKDSIISHKQSQDLVNIIKTNKNINKYLFYIILENHGHNNILQNYKSHILIYNFIYN